MRKSRLLFAFCLSLLFASCDDGGQNTPVPCGNGALDPGEACDGDEVPVEGCSALGYYQQTGDLACAADCTLDLSVCAGRCGDDAIDEAFGEQCEGADLAGETCASLGLGVGTLACTDACHFDTTGCEVAAVCGDGELDVPEEQCEGADLGGETCETLGYYGGDLSCDSDCTFELVSCATFGRCGDAQVQTAHGEDCDGANLNGGTCVALGFYGGDLSCGAACAFVLTNCEAVGRCGDDVRHADWGEVCDGADLDSETCETLGYHGGTLACDPGCQAFDLTDCEAAGRCGDGTVQAGFGEACDGADLNGETCDTLGYYGGTLACDGLCGFDLSGCEAVGRCGDGLYQPAYGEECDGAILGGSTCADYGFYEGALSCGLDCRLVTTACAQRCGDDEAQTAHGEACDGADLMSQTCQTRGYYGGTLACNADCAGFNEASCVAMGRCGDGTVQAGFGEACDGLNLVAQTCQSRGYYGGTLACAADCQAFDESACVVEGRCGDATVQAAYGEVCDGLNLNSQTCQTLGYYAGSLTCDADCRGFDESVCAAVGRCGDDILQPGYAEVCDGTALNSQTCVLAGYYGGSLACTANCQAYNYDNCIATGRCGDGAVQTGYGEECDGGNLNGETCQTQDFYVGILECGSDCRFVLTGCSQYCGDAWAQTGYGEQCDGTDLDGESCISLGYYGGDLSCDAGCQFGLTSCEAAGFCGDALVQPTHEDCDGTALEGETCRSLGHFTGTLGCDSLCGFDESDCHAVVQISAGYQHACVLLDDGTVKCWGFNFRGAVGPAAEYYQCTPVTVPGLSGVTGISSGYYHTCAVMADGTARCWGLNNYGQLGNGSFTDSTNPVQVMGIVDAVSIEVGNYHSCIVHTDGGVSCWGWNNDGQLGTGDTLGRAVPARVSSLTDVVQVSAGYNSTCARTSLGAVFCWGDNYWGELGDGTTTDRSTPVAVVDLVSAADLAVGDYSSCAILADGTARCWGRGSNGVLGNEDVSLVNSVPVVVTGLTDAVHISVDDVHACATHVNGTMHCWGMNSNGELGTGTTTWSPVPVPVLGMTTAIGLSAGHFFSCALKSDGNVSCWGDNEYCELGMGERRSNVPVEVGGLLGVGELVAGGEFACATDGAGLVGCWGRNANGQLGVGTTEDTFQIQYPLIETPNHLDAGAHHACATFTDGTMKCWGYNAYGQVGDGSVTDRTTPVIVSSVDGASMAAAGLYHTCVLKTDRTVRCWGRGNYGQLGDGTTNTMAIPVVVTGLNDVMSIAAGSSHTCALRMDGTLRCWGYNNSGQLGNGTTVNATTPVTPTGLTGVVAVSAGPGHTCVVLADGTVKCWGYNMGGQLGDGTVMTRTTPVTVSGLSGASRVACGNSHTCVVRTDGSAWCWGANSMGQLGTGNYTSSRTPLQVPGLTAASLAAGNDFTCVGLADGTARCWGDNTYGQLGVTNYPYSLVPVPVLP